MSKLRAYCAEKEGDPSPDGSQNGEGEDPARTAIADFRVKIKENPLTMQHIATMCHSFSVRNDVFRPKWFSFARFSKTSRMIFARINCTDDFLENKLTKMRFMSKFMPPDGTDVDPEVLDADHFWNCMLHVTIDEFAQLKAIVEKKGDPLKRLRYTNPVKKVHRPPPGFVRSSTSRVEAVPEVPVSNNVRKVDLLITMNQMIYLFYPMQGLEKQLPPGMPPIMKTKQKYAVPNENSPLFFLDTEMCVTDANMYELTRVTLLDENGHTVIDTYVKPYNKILFYITIYSGVTKEVMESTDVRVHDIQQAFRNVLPPDAIICGHSLEGDLRALRLSHPFCIDTSYIYNLSKFAKRTSLRGLSYFFLNKRIQCSGKGHCSYQDASAVLKLVKLKLANPREFGLAQFGFDYVKWAKENGLESCAEFFEQSIIKDIAREEYRNLKLPEPKEVGKCVDCGRPQMTQCYINECECSKNLPTYCFKCVGKNLEHSEPTGNRVFHFGKEVESISKFEDQRVPLAVRLRNYQRGRVLVARYLKPNQDMNHLSCKTMSVYDMNSYDHIDVFEQYVLKGNVFSNDLCLLEFNTHELDTDEVDKYIKMLYDQASSHSVIGLLFCGKSKAVFYSNTKLPMN